MSEPSDKEQITTRRTTETARILVVRLVVKLKIMLYDSNNAKGKIQCTILAFRRKIY